MGANYFKYAFLKNFIKKPVYLIFFITSKCNSKCRHCFYWDNLNKFTNELSLDEINKFSKQLKHIEWLTLSGGEPFIRKDIYEICKIFYENNGIKSLTIPTNGLLSEKIKNDVEKIAGLGLDVSINLSLDGLEKTHDFIRGVKGSFKKILKTYNELVKLKKGFSNLYVRVNTTINNKNYKEIGALDSFIKKNMPLIDSHNFEFMRGNPKDKSFKALNVKEIEELQNEIFDIRKSYEFFNSKIKSRLVDGTKRYLYKVGIEMLKNKKQIYNCLAGKTHCVLDANGNIFFCELLPSIGNIRKNSFNEIWNSEKAKKQREFIKNKGCYCLHSCFQNSNIVFNLRSYPYILVEALKR